MPDDINQLPLPDPEQIWYHVREIAEIMGIPVRLLYPKIHPLRIVNAITTMSDPADDRAILIHRDSLPMIFALKRTLLGYTPKGRNSHAR